MGFRAFYSKRGGQKSGKMQHGVRAFWKSAGFWSPLTSWSCEHCFPSESDEEHSQIFGGTKQECHEDLQGTMCLLERCWKLFLLLPRMLLHRPPRQVHCRATVSWCRMGPVDPCQTSSVNKQLRAERDVEGMIWNIVPHGHTISSKWASSLLPGGPWKG